MYIEAVPNRNSPPAILLRESYREGGRVRKRTICNLSDWPAAHIEGLRGVLRGGTVIAAERDAFSVIRSLPHGHVAAALGTARRIGLDRMLGPDGNRCRDLVLALLVGRILDPVSKLAAARALSPDTAASSLGEVLGLGAVDEDQLYTALDWLLQRQPAIETALAKRHLQNGTLVLYDVSSSYLEGRCCPLARRGYSRDGRRGTLQITYGLLCAPDGCPVAIEVFVMRSVLSHDGNTADPMTLATQVEKLKQRFDLDHVVLVGDRGMITQARITEDIRAAGLDWISALRAPAIKQLLEGGRLQLSLFDQRDMASITAPEFPGERLVVCHNPDLAAERARKRCDLLASTERDLARIKTAVDRKRKPLRGTAEIGLAVGAVINQHKMAKHFDLDITDGAFSFARKTAQIAAEAATDGLYVVRTSLPAETLETQPRCPATNPWRWWSGRFGASKPWICRSARCITGWRIGCARMSSCACWHIISNGTCASAWHRCCSTTLTRMPPKRCAAAWWRKRNVRPPRSPSRPRGRPRTGSPCTASARCWPIWRPWRATPSPPRSRPTIRSPCSPGRRRSNTRRSISSASQCSQ
jgi:hypothetical protein